MRAVRKAILWTINRAGYDLVRSKAHPRGFVAAHLARFFSPRTVIDVGAAEGTPPLLEAFPTAKFILIEPLVEYQEPLRDVQAKYDCKVFFCAAGASPGEAQLQVSLDDPQKSSFSVRTALTKRNHKFSARTVPVRTLDDIAAECGELPRPILLKVDTEGHELETLKGSTALLKRVDVIIAEASVANRFENGYRFEELVSFMAARGFRFTDVLSIAHARDELAPHHMDVLFTRD